MQDPEATATADPNGHPRPDRTWSRRRFLALGAGGAAAIVVVGAVGIELVNRGLLPGKQQLDQLDGECSVSLAPFTFSALGPTVSGRFFSAARNRSVGYTIGYPPAHGPGEPLPLVVMLHGFGGDHTDALAGMSPAQAVALTSGGRPIPPMALVTVDGGGGYWNPHPGDDPMAMLVNELIPMLRTTGLGQPPHKIGTMGTSMGGYGAILMAEKHPHLIDAVAAISPAVWTSYEEARSANAGAYSSPAHFADNDAVSHAGALAGIPVRVASGNGDPFHPGVEALARALPAGATVNFSPGCHNGSFFAQQEPPSLAFLAHHLSA